MARTPKHGTISMYIGARCRCEACREAWNGYRRVKYHEKRAWRKSIIAAVISQCRAERNARRLLVMATKAIPMPLHSPRYARILNRQVSNAA